MPESGDQGSDSKKANETREMLCYLNTLIDKDHEQLLKSLVNMIHTPPKVGLQSLDDSMSQLDNACNEEVQSQLYEEAKAKEVQQKANLANKYGSSNLAHQLHSGLPISLVPCSDKSIGDVKVFLRKGDRGANPFACKKTRDKIVKALKLKISAGNISRILPSVDASKYDVAADALSWQSSLKVITKFCTQYDMLSLIKIPQGMDLA